MTASKQPVQTPRKRATKSVRRLPDEPVAEMGLAGQPAQPETDVEALTGEFIGKATESRALVSLLDEPVPDEDEEVIKRVEHLNHSVGWHDRPRCARHPLPDHGGLGVVAGQPQESGALAAGPFTQSVPWGNEADQPFLGRPRKALPADRQAIG